MRNTAPRVLFRNWPAKYYTPDTIFEGVESLATPVAAMAAPVAAIVAPVVAIATQMCPYEAQYILVTSSTWSHPHVRLDYKMSAPMENGRFECKKIINVDLCSNLCH